MFNRIDGNYPAIFMNFNMLRLSFIRLVFTDMIGIVEKAYNLPLTICQIQFVIDKLWCDFRNNTGNSF